jgi:hypothetical protein
VTESALRGPVVSENTSTLTQVILAKAQAHHLAMEQARRVTPVDQREMWHVDANFGTRREPRWVNVYTGHRHYEAVRLVNWWDERVPVRHDLDKPMDDQSVINRKFDRVIEHIRAGGFG